MFSKWKYTHSSYWLVECCKRVFSSFLVCVKVQYTRNGTKTTNSRCFCRIMFSWTASKLPPPRELSPMFLFSPKRCLKLSIVIKLKKKSVFFFFYFVYLFFSMAGLGTDCQQSDHGLCYRQWWTSIRVCSADGEGRFLGDLRFVCGS